MLLRFALPLLVILAACTSNALQAPPQCPPPDGGAQCACPGTSTQPLGCSAVFTCMQNGMWAPYDAACLQSNEPGDASPQDGSGDAGDASAPD